MKSSFMGPLLQPPGSSHECDARTGILDPMTFRASFLVLAVTMAALTACTDAPADREVGEVPPPQDEQSATPTPPSSTETPALQIEQGGGGLQHGWGTRVLPA